MNNIKIAKKQIEQQVSLISQEVLDWKNKHQVVFDNLAETFKNEHSKMVQSLQKNQVQEGFVKELKKYEASQNKMIDNFTNDVMAINQNKTQIVKGLNSGLGAFAERPLAEVKYRVYGTGPMARDAIKREAKIIIEENLYDNNKKSAKDLKKYLLSCIKDLKSSPFESESELVAHVARIELFSQKMLQALKSSIHLKPEEQKWIKSNEVLQNLRDTTEYFMFKSHVSDTLKLFDIDQSKNLKPIINSYGKSKDDACFKRAKSGVPGIHKCLTKFKDCFTNHSDDSDFESRLRFINNSLKMYVEDIISHVNLTKACLVDDKLAIDEAYSMDTEPRDLVSRTIHNYVNSHQFSQDLLQELKNSKKKKIKP